MKSHGAEVEVEVNKIARGADVEVMKLHGTEVEISNSHGGQTLE